MPKEISVVREDELKDGQMKEIQVNGVKVLLTKLDGVFYAIGGECSHYGGPLAEGFLSGDVVTCPWHQARFDVATGAVHEPPALDDMCGFSVRVEGGRVILRLPDAPETRCAVPMVTYDPDRDGRTFVILGAGGAGAAAALKLRQTGFYGRILMFTKEARLPYDRPNLSKGYLSGEEGPDSLPLKDENFWREYGIGVMSGMTVVQVDPGAKSLTTADGAIYTYDALLLATGGEPRRLAVPGADLAGVFTLRSADDADRLAEAAAQAAKVAVVGGGFIGMEAAASLRKRGLKVTVINSGQAPFERALGPEVGRVFQKIHEEEGVAFRLGERVQRLEGEGRVKAVILNDGERLDCDLVLVGMGVAPATGMLTGVPLNPDGSVTVDAHLRVMDGLYAAGDIARFPDWRTGEMIRIEHWRTAQQQGQIAALNMAGRPAAFQEVPFFWTVHFDYYLQYLGHAATWDEVLVHGSLEDRKFVAFYVKGGRILAAAGMEHDYGLAYLADLMRAGQMPAPDAVRREDPELVQHLRK